MFFGADGLLAVSILGTSSSSSASVSFSWLSGFRISRVGYQHHKQVRDEDQLVKISPVAVDEVQTRDICLLPVMQVGSYQCEIFTRHRRGRWGGILMWNFFFLFFLFLLVYLRCFLSCKPTPIRSSYPASIENVGPPHNKTYGWHGDLQLVNNVFLPRLIQTSRLITFLGIITPERKNFSKELDVSLFVNPLLSVLIF